MINIVMLNEISYQTYWEIKSGLGCLITVFQNIDSEEDRFSAEGCFFAFGRSIMVLRDLICFLYFAFDYKI